MSGTLYVCATPIGNLEDITLRALRILKECDAIACEDTRHSLALLKKYDISKPLISYFEHNEQQKSELLIQKLMQGENIVLVSDAGTPCISDPGFILVSKCREQNIPVTVLPGANAGLCALVLSGFKCDRFVFEGFLPKNNKERKQRLESLKNEERTVILHESPHHLEKTLDELFEFLGERKIALAREMTKIYEECIIFNLSDRKKALSTIKGEFVIVIEGSQKQEKILLSPREQVELFISQGMTKKDAIKLTAQKMGVPKNEIYMQVID